MIGLYLQSRTGAQGLNIADRIQTPHIQRLYREHETLMRKVQEYVQHQIANPKPASSGPQGSEREKEIYLETVEIQKAIRARLAITKALFRRSTMEVREEKAKTAEAKSFNDSLILQLHNLKYEEQSLSAEISAATNYEYAGLFFS
jgi:THO complex subunit 5